METTIHEDLIKITKYELVDKLPNPFVFNDGTKLESTADWQRRKKEIFDSAVTLQYGTMPPQPEFLEVETLYLGGTGKPNIYRIITGKRNTPVTFTMTLFKPDIKEKTPVVISGDHCFPYVYDKAYIDAYLRNGISFAVFNRTELAPDIARHNLHLLDHNSGEYENASQIFAGIEGCNCGGQLKRIYPEYTFGAIGAWAWGYSRCVDALEILGNVDLDLIAFTGHSRGGKTAILAGVLDERAKIVNPNQACAAGCSCYRLNVEAVTEDGETKVSEPLSNICRAFPSWLNADMQQYVGREAELPFDSHFLKALVAPRVLFVSEAASDIWSNPIGSWVTSEAAKEVYKFLGCAENLFWYFRRGYHAHTEEDVLQLINIIKHIQSGEPLNDKFFKAPFRITESAFDWKCPE